MVLPGGVYHSMMTLPEAHRPSAEAPPHFPAATPISARQMWANNRFWMETQHLVSKRHGRRRQHWDALMVMLKVLEWGLARVGQLERGRRNAAAIVLRDLELRFPDLPGAFDGFTVLHVSDPHLDGLPGIDERIVALTRGRSFDLCVLTGDYRMELHGPIRPVMASLRRLVEAIDSREGFLGVLGNHDDCHMVEAMGIRMLVNESVVLGRGPDRLRVVGTDDVHYYFTDQSVQALEPARDDFTIALVHSPELYQAAADAGVNLYLCGHTHGGQIRLPGGFAPLRHLRIGRHLYRGHWRHGSMQGVTNEGAGTSGIPVRFNTQSELLALTLRRA
jgi:predicted MPP superfamily phosphohydrolase